MSDDAKKPKMTGDEEARRILTAEIDKVIATELRFLAAHLARVGADGEAAVAALRARAQRYETDGEE